MRTTWFRFASVATVALLLGVAACNSESTQNPPDPDAVIRISNQTLGPVLFVNYRTCGSGNWGPDRLGTTERIEIGDEREFPVESGCWDIRAQHLENPEESVLVTQTNEDNVIAPNRTFLWVLSPEIPGQQ